MQFITYASVAFAALVSAQSQSQSSSYSYSNDATTLLTQTNSLGVITGMPSQPAAATNIGTLPTLATSQAPAALVPAGFPGGTTTATYGNQTFTIVVSGNSTSLITTTPTPTTTTNAGTSGTASGASGSGSSASAKSSSTGNAGTHLKVGGAALAAAGGFFAIFM